jgi:hypothetical protein
MIKKTEVAGASARRGRPPTLKPLAKKDLIRLYVTEAKSIREIATELGFSKDHVYRALLKFNIVARPNAKRSMLRALSVESLEAEIKQRGIRGYARYLNVDEGTIRHHLKARKAQ